MNKKKLNIIAIIQARVGSTRLPNKIFLPLINKPILWHVYQRVTKSILINKTVIATTDLKEDDIVEKFCIKNSIEFFRGSSEDVLSRFYYTAQKYNADIVVRITSDCPLIDSKIIDLVVEKLIKNNADYASNVLERTFPRGYDAEAFTFEALTKTFHQANAKFEHEHVTPFIYNNPNQFKLISLKNEQDYSKFRLTVDTKEDYELIKIIYESLYEDDNNFGLNEVIQFLNKNVELVKINEHIEQKKLNE